MPAADLTGHSVQTMASRNFKSAAMYGITSALGDRDGPGWNVILKRNGVRFAKPFPFSRFGGEEAALVQAQAWRDEMVKAHPPASRQQRANQLRSTNKTGIPGVTCMLGPDGKPRTWVAKTQIAPDKTLQAKFSIARHGPEAKLLAIAARQKQLQQLTGLAFVHPSEAVVREAAPRPIPPDIPEPLAKAEIVRRTNKSGVPGVRRVEAKDRCSAYWGAITASGDGRKSLSKFFSIKTHGEERAKELAIAERQRQLRRVKKRGLDWKK